MLKIENISVAIGEARVMELLSKSEILQATSSSMLAYMTARSDNTANDANNRTKPNIFHEAFFQKLGIDTERLTRMLSKQPIQ